MDFEEFRSLLGDTGVDIWTFIDTAISVASIDYGKELKGRRDGIVEKLYSKTWDHEGSDIKEKGENRIKNEYLIEKNISNYEGKNASPSTPVSNGAEEEQYIYEESMDQEQSKIFAIKDRLEDPNEPEETLITLLQTLADMDITFKALQETDIGRHVNRLRKNQSAEIRRLVKQLVRKWKDLVDEWVKSNAHETSNRATIKIESLTGSFMAADGDSPLQQIAAKTDQNGSQAPELGYSPNYHNGSSSSDRNHYEQESRGKVISKRESEMVHNQSRPINAVSTKQKEQKEVDIDERLASARKRLHENYQEAENAKKQRTIQVMDLHEIPKPKSTFFARNKGGFQAKHW